MQEVEWGRTLGPRGGEAETSGTREGLSVLLPQWVLRPGPPSETCVPCQERSPHAASLARPGELSPACVCCLSSGSQRRPQSDRSLCRDSLPVSSRRLHCLHGSPKSKTNPVLLFLSSETPPGAPCHRTGSPRPTKPGQLSPACLSVSFTSPPPAASRPCLLPCGLPLHCSKPVPSGFLPFWRKTPAPPRDSGRRCPRKRADTPP